MSQGGTYIGGTSTIDQITGNVGVAIPVAGNVNIIGAGSISTSGAGDTLTITSTGGGLAWNEVLVTGPTTMSVNNGYIANNAGVVQLLLPAAATQGSIIRVTGKGAGGWQIQQGNGQTIYFGIAATTTGMAGSLSSTQQRDTVELVCVTANNDWNVLSSIGNITFA